MTAEQHEIADDTGADGVAWALMRAGEVIDEGAAGLADRHIGRAATVETPFLLGSITKPIVATVALRLAERGLLDLDAPVSALLPPALFDQTAGHPEVATITDVLQHVGGYGTHHDFAYENPATPTDEMIGRYGARFRVPQSAFEYSNLGYAVVGRAIEAVTSAPLGDVIHVEIAEPLGLRSFAFGASPPERAAERYAASGVAYPSYDTSHAAASLAWLNAHDLAAFGQAHHAEHGLVGRDALARAHTPSAVTRSAPIGYGLGWAIRSVAGNTVLVHGGSMGGVSTGMIVVPDLAISAAVVANVTDRSSTVDTLLEDLVRSTWPAYSPITGEPPPSHVPCVGRWNGRAVTPSGEVSVELNLDGESADVIIDGLTASSRTFSFDGTRLVASAPVQVPTADAAANSPTCQVDVSLVDGRLVGALRATKDDESGDRIGNCFSHWCNMTPR